MSRATVFLMVIVSVFCLGSRAQGFGVDPFSARAEIKPGEGGEMTVTVTITVAPEHYLYVDKVSIEAAAPAKLVPRQKPEFKEKFDELLGETIQIYVHDVVFVFGVTGLGSDPLSLTVKYQGCSNAGVCYMPGSETFSLVPAGVAAGAVEPVAAGTGPAVKVADVGWKDAVQGFQVQGRKSGYLAPAEFIGFLDEVDAGRGLEENRLGALFRTKGAFLLIVAVLLGGLALNLTPCVLPMIPINLAIIGAGAQAGSKGRGFLLGGLYGAGIALVYGALGLVVVLTGAKFGALNASPWFNLGIAVVFLGLALAMFDVFVIDFSRFQGAGGPDDSKRGRMITAFAMGGVAALLAGACVAPVVISVLLLSADLYSGGNAAGLLLPFLLGVGMALPWPFAGAGLSFLPKPGLWMTRVKMGFGVFIILFAGWYGYLGVSLLRDGSAGATGQETQSDGDWHTDLVTGLAVARAEGKPVFVDFWAEWCKNCLKMEKTTFKDAAVQARLAGYVKVKFRAEDLGAADVKPVLDHFGVIGLPTYVVLVPAGGGGDEARP